MDVVRETTVTKKLFGQSFCSICTQISYTHIYLMLVFGVPRFFFPEHKCRKRDVRGENLAQVSLTQKEESQFS